MSLLRRLVYRLGCRPKAGSILYSPSAAFIYAIRDAWRAEELRAKP